ncbi:MAG: hypothetical protein GY835_01935 [bacterium]|nr:hypothetical protein [bacterium]
MKTLKIVTLFALLIFATNAMALDQEGGGRIIVGSPTGEFGDAVDNLGIGLELNYGLRPMSALSVGIGINAMMYGSETREYELPLVEDFELNTHNNLAGFFLYTQWRPLMGIVQPYVEARVGINYLWTESKLQDEDWWDDDEVGRETNYDDFAAFWSGGGGLLVRIKEGDVAENSPGVFLDFKVTCMQGAEAEYLTEGDITIVDNAPVFNVSQSTTDMTTFGLGVILTF